MKYVCLANDNYPIEIITPWRKHWFENVLRLLIHTRRIRWNHYWNGHQCVKVGEVRSPPTSSNVYGSDARNGHLETRNPRQSP